MSWERGRYYTRSRRVNGRLVREYVGGGGAGKRAAVLDARRRRRVERRRREELERRSTSEELERLSADLVGDVSVIVRASVVLGGGYVHRGELRRRRAD